MVFLLVRMDSMHDLAASPNVERCKWVMHLNNCLSTLQSGSVAALLTTVVH